MSVAAGMDVTFRGVLTALPEPLRDFSSSLPHRLGLTRWPDGGFEDFWVLDINRDLPGYVIANLPVREPDAMLDAYRRAHHCAAVYGLVADRLGDRQVEFDPRLVRIARVFRRAWEDALAEATSSERARSVIARALRSLRRGTRMERRALVQRQLTLPVYVLQTREKLRWGGAAARCLVEEAVGEQRATLLERSYDRFCFALQCLDDAMDSADDERVHGVSVPTMLGLPAGALVRATPAIVAGARNLAEEGGFHQLAEWLRRFHGLCVRLEPDGDATGDARLGRFISQAAEELA